ncbi:MAG TPA: hypothetical protein V6C91_04565, partial [Coleofasciculaceae cyanobacterium]
MPINAVAYTIVERLGFYDASRFDRRVMNNPSINSLLEDLKNPDENIRNQATAQLWRIWFY